MRNLIAGFILIITFSMLCKAEVPNGAQSSPAKPSDTESRTSSEKANGDSVDRKTRPTISAYAPLSASNNRKKTKGREKPR